MNTTIEKANEYYIPIIQELAFEIWQIAYKEILSEEQLLYMIQLFYNHTALENQMLLLNHKFLIIKDSEKELGFASYSIIEKNESKLQKLYVLPHLKGKGLGYKLLNEVIKEVRKEKSSNLILNVNRNNEAVEFYKRNGFEIDSSEDIDIGNGYFMNDYIMRLSL
jgi:GNAT superfamily N-acetyltransferase